MKTLKLKIERSVNSLLKNSVPNQFQKNIIYRHLLRYYGYSDTFEDFCLKISLIYREPKKEFRYLLINKVFNIKFSKFDCDPFLIGFHNSDIHTQEILYTSSEIKWLLDQYFRLPNQICSTNVFMLVISNMIQNSKQNTFIFEFDDFYLSWKNYCFIRYGNKYQNILDDFYKQFNKNENEREHNLEFNGSSQLKSCQTIFLTQTQIEWLNEICAKIELNTNLPIYPLRKEALNPKVKKINQQVIQFNTYNNKADTQAKEDLNHIKNNIYSLCVELLGKKENQNAKENLEYLKSA